MGEKNRSERTGALLRYLRQLALAGHSGRVQITLEFNRGGIARIYAHRLERDETLWPFLSDGPNAAPTKERKQ